jgi:hypothetical protein
VINEDSVVFDDDVVEINTMESPSIHKNPMTKKKKSRRSIGRPQQFGPILMNFLLHIQMAQGYGQDVSFLIINI